MKKILLLASSLVVLPLITSCTDYGVYGTTVGATTFGNPGFVGGGFGNPGFVGGGFAPLQVGFVATSFDRWAYDPYRRHYFDRSCGRYFDPGLGSYCAVAPRRFATAVYPSGYNRGGRLACPSYLPRTAVVAHRGSQFGRGYPGSVVSNQGRFAPVVHGSSRGSSQFRGSDPYRGTSTGNYDRGSYDRGSYDRGSSDRGSSDRFNPIPSPVRRTVTPVPSRRTESPTGVSRSGRLETISSGSPQRGSSSGDSSFNPYTPPVVRNQPVIRSQPVVRSQPSYPTPSSRPTPTVRSSGYDRSTNSPSRGGNQVRQRTR